MPAWRTTARDLSLLFCAALVSYIVWVIIAARLGGSLVAALGARPSLPVRLLLGTAVLDLAKAPALLLLAWALRRILALRPSLAALALVGFTYALELLAASALGGGPSLEWSMLASRTAAVLLLFLAARWVFARCR